jgi:hypothetical protein
MVIWHLSILGSPIIIKDSSTCYAMALITPFLFKHVTGLFQLYQFTFFDTTKLLCVHTILFVTVYYYRNRRWCLRELSNRAWQSCSRACFSMDYLYERQATTLF